MWHDSTVVGGEDQVRPRPLYVQTGLLVPVQEERRLCLRGRLATDWSVRKQHHKGDYRSF